MQRQDSPQRSQSAAFTHTERARGTALVGPLVALGVAAAFVAVILLATESWATWIALAAILLLGAWYAWGARIAVTVDDESVRLRAPLYSREIPLSALSSVIVAPDDGMNPGSLNWPAVPVREGATRLIRLNLGGGAAVTCRTQDGSGVQLVVRDLAAAERIADTLRR
ncbi:hypothetical protein ACFSWE_06760 [Leucobacter albus]|uniref:DUF3093 family protein n=1 Tax=Leucobacter albus TaxID=272210 RepID=A0ABW3TJC2_9MICO